MDRHNPSPQTLFRLRRGAHQFLRRYAALTWEHEAAGWRHEILLPPEIEKLPKRKRYRAHARHEARRLADAALYDLDPDATRRAVQFGAALREDRHPLATALAQRPDIIDTLNIQPPAATGFLRWRDPHGISYNARGAPTVACHWGPTDEGIWVVWWDDSHALIKSYAADTQGTWTEPILTPGTALPLLGPLWYGQQQLLRPYRDAPADTPPADTLPAMRAQPARPVEGHTFPPVDDEVIAVLYTTLATWSLLADPPTGIDLDQHPPAPAEETADRETGLPTRPITVATTARATR